MIEEIKKEIWKIREKTFTKKDKVKVIIYAITFNLGLFLMMIGTMLSIVTQTVHITFSIGSITFLFSIIFMFNQHLYVDIDGKWKRE